MQNLVLFGVVASPLLATPIISGCAGTVKDAAEQALKQETEMHKQMATE